MVEILKSAVARRCVPYLAALTVVLGATTAPATELRSPQPAGMPSITILYDAFGRDPNLRKDWGFAALVEINGRRILFDTGNNAEVFAANVRAMQVDLTALDFVVMSHRHGDHIGGLNHLLSVNDSVPIYAPKEIFGVFGASLPGAFLRGNPNLADDRRYFGGNPPQRLEFGTPWPTAEFRWVAETSEIMPGVHLVALRGLWGVDLEVLELSLAIETPDGLVLIVGCGHPEIEKIVEAAIAATGKAIHLLVGGLHLLPAGNDKIRQIATDLREKWQVGWIAPAHCTGESAFEILSDIFKSHYLYAGLGTTLELGPRPVALPRHPLRYPAVADSVYADLARRHRSHGHR